VENPVVSLNPTFPRRFKYSITGGSLAHFVCSHHAHYLALPLATATVVTPYASKRKCHDTWVITSHDKVTQLVSCDNIARVSWHVVRLFQSCATLFWNRALLYFAAIGVVAVATSSCEKVAQYYY